MMAEDQSLTRADVVQIMAAFEGVAKSLDGFAHELRIQRKRTDQLKWFLSVIFVALLALGGVGLSNRQVTSTIEDCTQTQGQCYQESQKRTASVVGPISEKLEANHRATCALVSEPKKVEAGC